MAGITINIRQDVWKLRDQLDNFGKTQMPFATARALTAVATLAKGDVLTAMPQRFDRPTPFTERGPSVAVATKSSQRAKVFIKDKQAQYLKLQETGGVGLPKKRALVIPVDIKLNAYGNMPNHALLRMKGKRGVFVGSVTLKSGHKIAGFWQRLPNHHLRLLAEFFPQAKFKPRFGYNEIVRRRVSRDINRVLKDQIDRAMRTALATR